MGTKEIDMIDIIMTTDEHYITQAKVAIYSVCKHTAHELNLTMLCATDLPMECRDELYELKSDFPQLDIHFSEVTEEVLLKAEIDYYVTNATFFRLVCAQAVEAKKAIFLDSDIVVTMDIAELYEVDMGDCYLAGVRDMYPILFPNFAARYARDYQLADFSDYINCGVLVMNLKAIREHHLTERFLAEMKQKNLFVDQDILNRVCHGNIMILDWRFNYIPRNTREEYIWVSNTSHDEEQGEIIHYCGPTKPWTNTYSPEAESWWGMAQEALGKEEYESYRRNAYVTDDSGQALKVVQKCADAQSIMIVGFSDHGRYIELSMRRYGICKPIRFCDNSKEKQSLRLGDEKVYSLSEAAKSFKESVWINAVQGARDEIDDQLIRLGIPKEKIVHYFFKSMIYA